MSNIETCSVSLQKAFAWLTEYVNSNKDSHIWDVRPDPNDTALAIIALNEAGEGPKISKAQFEWQQKLTTQHMNTFQPHFIHTSPIFGNAIHIKQIHDKIVEMIQQAKYQVRVSSLYFDMLYEQVIDLANRLDIEFRIIVRPKADIKGRRDRIAKNVLDLLKVSTKGGVRTNPIVHARMLIIDDREVLISTADLTRDQLFDEYNAGIWTKNPVVIEKAIEFFDNVWDDSDTLS